MRSKVRKDKFIVEQTLRQRRVQGQGQREEIKAMGSYKAFKRKENVEFHHFVSSLNRFNRKPAVSGLC